MSTLSNIFTRIFTTLSFGQVKIGGTIRTLGVDDAYPTHISNLGFGGHHSYENVQDLAGIPAGRLQVGMTCSVPQYIDTNNNVIKRTKYILEKLLPLGIDKLSDIPNYDISEYWKVEMVADDYSGAFQTQYAPNIDILTNTVDINGGQPAFPGKSGGGIKVTQAQYNATTYWVDTYDATKNHVWQRQRFADSPNANWGIPVKISGESYAQGDYINNLFKRSVSIPDTPAQFIGGLPNNNPSGWFDVPQTGASALWLTKAQKDTYGQLKSPWTTPIEIVTNPLLVRYNEVATPNPNSLAYADLATNGWVAIFDTLVHKYLATRQEVSTGVYTQWSVIKIADESGEYIDYVYKGFDLALVDDVLQNPDTYRPSGTIPVSWSDTPILVGTTQQLFISSARKYITGELINIWSDPIPFSGSDTILSLITSSGGDEFKWNKNVTPNTVAPTQLVLTALLYRGVTPLVPDSISWTKIYNNGNLANVNLGTASTITILPADVTGKAIFKATQLFQGTSYHYEYSILDISDGIDAKSLVLTANSQIITHKVDGSRLPTSLTLTAYSSNLSDEGAFSWYQKPFGGAEIQVMANGSPYLANQLAINYADFATSIEITYRVVSVDGLADDFTVYQVEEASGGAPAILMILSNESHNLVQDEMTGITNYTGASTRVKILEGATDVTAQWIIKKTDSTGITSSTTYVTGSTTNIAIDPVAGVGTYPIQVTNIGSTISAAFVTITATKGTVTLNKQFSLSKIIDPVGSIILDIDSSNNGFAFSPNNQTDKQLTATLYLDGTPIALTTGFEWKFDSVTQASITNQITVTPSLVAFNLTVRAKITYRGATYSRTINIVDVKDAKGIGIRYTDRNTDGGNDGEGNPVSDNDKPDSSVVYNSTAAANTGHVYWYTGNVPNAVFMSIRKADDTSWGTPIRIKGEHGDQGKVGNFINNIFKWSASIPTTPMGNPIPATWSDTPPPLVQNQALWMSLGEVTTATPTIPSQLVGVWSTPVQVSGTQGANSTVQGPAGRSVQVFVQVAQPTVGPFFDGDIWISQ